MWGDHPFSQRNMTTERTMGVGVGGDREVRGGGGRGVAQNLKKGIGIGNTEERVFIK